MIVRELARRPFISLLLQVFTTRRFIDGTWREAASGLGGVPTGVYTLDDLWKASADTPPSEDDPDSQEI